MNAGILTILILSGAVLAACSTSDRTAPVPRSLDQRQDSTPQAVTSTVSDSVFHEITAEAAKEMMDGGGVTVLDVRTEEEYQAGHIPGSILLPNESIGDAPPDALPDKDAVLLVHCRTGVRSSQAADKLVKMGYRHVYDFGGIVDWPYETISSN